LPHINRMARRICSETILIVRAGRRCASPTVVPSNCPDVLQSARISTRLSIAEPAASFTGWRLGEPAGLKLSGFKAYFGLLVADNLGAPFRFVVSAISKTQSCLCQIFKFPLALGITRAFRGHGARCRMSASANLTFLSFVKLK